MARAWKTTAWWTAGYGLLALFGAGNAAAFVPPEQHWYLQLLGVAVPVFGVALVLVAASAAVARRWWLGWSLALAVAFATALPFHPVSTPVSPHVSDQFTASEDASADAPRRLSAEPLRVMTFNANPAGLRNQDGLPGLLDREEPHVVALQEFGVRLDRATGVQMGPPLLAPFIKGNRFEISWPKNGGGVSIRQPILSRLERAGPVEIVPHNPAGRQQEGVWSSGGITRGTYKWEGQTVAVYSVHLHSFGRERPWRESAHHVFSLAAWTEALRTYRGDFKTRADQARLLRRMLEEEEVPFIVCGDLNSTPYSWVYGHLSKGLTDAFRTAGRGWGGTFPTRLPFVRIDVVLVSEEWEVMGAHVSDAVSSDHRPVIAELRLRPRTGADTDRLPAE